MFDFNKDSVKCIKDLETKFNGHELFLVDIYPYNGPVTMQYLPYGGIQSVFDHQIIINTKEGFIATRKVIYDGKEMTSEEFIEAFPHLVNTVLPN